MFDYLKKIPFIIFFIIIISAIFSDSVRLNLRRIVGGFSDGVVDVEKFISKKIDNLKTSFADNSKLKDELLDVRLALEEERLKNYSFNSLVDDHNEIMKELKMNSKYDFNVKYAKVITRDPVHWWTQFVIDRGEESGIKVGQAVLYNNSLIGRISEVRSNESIVITIANQNCKVSCKINGYPIFGILKGLGDSAFLKPQHSILDFVFRDALLSNGMIVETSGFGKQIPAGIPVGYIIDAGNKEKKISETVNYVYQKIKVSTYANLEDINFVAIIVNQK